MYLSLSLYIYIYSSSHQGARFFVKWITVDGWLKLENEAHTTTTTTAATTTATTTTTTINC